MVGPDYPRTYREFVAVFSNEAACRAYLEALRWPEGMVCPVREAATAPWRQTRGRLVCPSCRHQATVTAGTILDKTRTPLTTWFEAAWHLTTAKNEMSAVTLERTLGCSVAARTVRIASHHGTPIPPRHRLDGHLPGVAHHLAGQPTGHLAPNLRMGLHMALPAVGAAEPPPDPNRHRGPSPCGRSCACTRRRSCTLWTVVGVAGFSRLIGAVMVPSRAAHDVLGGMLQIIESFGAVPRKAVWDQEGCIGRIRGGKQVLSDEFQTFRGVLGMGAVLVGPNDPEAKGLVERANGYLETSFLPGRSFEDVADFNGQLGVWLGRANQRVHGTTRVRPSEAIFEDRGAMMGFPPVLPDPSWRFTTRLPRDHYVRADTNDYSVDPRHVGRRVDVQVTLSEVIVTCESVEVARHRRCLAKHQSILAPDHARVLRQIRAETVEPAPVEIHVEERDLGVYDQLIEVA